MEPKEDMIETLLYNRDQLYKRKTYTAAATMHLEAIIDLYTKLIEVVRGMD